MLRTAPRVARRTAHDALRHFFACREDAGHRLVPVLAVVRGIDVGPAGEDQGLHAVEVLRGQRGRVLRVAGGQIETVIGLGYRFNE